MRVALGGFCLIAVVMFLAVASCDDGERQSIRLENGAVTEEQLRMELIRAVVDGRDVINLICRASDFSDGDSVMELTSQLFPEGPATAAAPEASDVSRLLEIVREECLRLQG